MEPYRFTDEEKSAFRKAYAPSATDDQWNLFIAHCERQNLIPGRHVYFRIQPTNVYDPVLQNWVTEPRVVLITSIEAMTLIASRTGKYNGQRPVKWQYKKIGGDEVDCFDQSDIPRGCMCHSATVEILHKDWEEPVRGVARYDACVQRDGNGQPNSIWAKRGEEMTAKCARADAFRQAFPEELGKLYIPEEMQASDPSPVAGGTVVAQLAATTTPVPAAVRALYAPEPVLAPPVNQAPAEEKQPRDPMEAIDRITHEINRPTELAQKAPAPVAPAVIPEVSIFDSEADEPAVIMFDALHDVAATMQAPEEAVVLPIAALPQVQAVQQAEMTAAPLVPDVQPISPDVLKEAAAIAEQVLGKELPPDLAVEHMPTVPEYRAYMARCTKLVRDVLQKAGKEGEEASKLFLPYLQKVTGKAKTQEMTSEQLARLLTQFEGMKVQELIKLLKGK